MASIPSGPSLFPTRRAPLSIYTRRVPSQTDISAAFKASPSRTPNLTLRIVQVRETPAPPPSPIDMYSPFSEGSESGRSEGD
ncbi:hypothetical protein LTR60_002505, partial [Cryomyces antarcticus]